jgi:fused signal recognition particle receptor
VFDGVKQATATGIDALIVDTAGRLQNKTHLMEELSKVRRVLGRLNSEAPHDVILVLDATTGQNALNQIEVFRDLAGVTGLVMTKLDGTHGVASWLRRRRSSASRSMPSGSAKESKIYARSTREAVARAIAGLSA